MIKIDRNVCFLHIMSDDDKDWVQSDAIVDDDWDISATTNATTKSA